MRRFKSILELAIGLMILIVANQLLDRFPFRWDLTEDSRYSVSDPTKKLLNSLQETVYVEVFLEGEMPSGFKRLKSAIRNTLEQYNYYSAGMVEYKFTDPSQAKSTQARNEFYRSLMQKGLQPTNLSFTENGNKTEKLIFPAAMVSYLGKELPITLLKGNRASSADERLNQSIEGIEYQLSSGILQLASDRKKNVGLIKGHGEPDSLNLAGFTNALLQKYNVYHVDLPRKSESLDFYDALVFPKPTTSFSEPEKFLIDQYIMNGGKALFFIDALRVNMDSASGEGTIAFPYELGLDDMLFRYGVRINRNYVQDVVCGEYPVVAGYMGDQPQIRMLPWPFFPIVNNLGNHAIVKNLDAVSMKFVSTMDTVKADGIQKIPLLTTSQYSLVAQPPVKVSFNELQKTLDPERFNAGPQVVSYLLSGQFSSLYQNRILPDGVDKRNFKETGEKTSLIICADGDMIRNEFDLQTGEPMALGQSPYSQMSYANEDFVLNSIDYLLNEEGGLITSKVKSVKLRPLDKVKIVQEKIFWQVLNLAAPMIVLVIFGIVRAQLRKRRYGRS